MIYGIGTDIVDIKRVKNAVARNPRFVERIFTEQELEYIRKRNMNIQSIAGGFSAKEAVLKALGTGLGPFSWKNIEILRINAGKPIVILNTKAKKYAEENGIGNIHITISHTKDYATATAVAELSLEREGMVIEDLLLQTNEESGRKIH